jgi:hypothetical protein
MTIKMTIPNSVLNLDKRIKAGIRRGLQQSSIELAGIPNTKSGGLIKDQMNKPKTGRIYPIIIKRGIIYINHQASRKKSRESSAILAGELAMSVKGKTLGSSRLEISADTPYAAIQEYGGINSEGVYIAPRKNLNRPIRKYRGRLLNNIKQSIK